MSCTPSVTLSLSLESPPFDLGSPQQTPRQGLELIWKRQEVPRPWASGDRAGETPENGAASGALAVGPHMDLGEQGRLETGADFCPEGHRQGLLARLANSSHS